MFSLESLRKYYFQMRKVSIAILMIIFFACLLLIEIAESNDHDVYQVQKDLQELGYGKGHWQTGQDRAGN
jgi:preprotein translocase subunit SecG